MNSRLLTKTDGDWPRLNPLIGAEVLSVDLREADAALTLAFSGDREIVVPSPWQYVSCLLALSSADFDATRHDPQNISELVGLCGARLTGLESDRDHFDLILGSIRISVKLPSLPKP